MHIKRFDPNNKQSFALLINKEKNKNTPTEPTTARNKQKMLEEGRKQITDKKKELTEMLEKEQKKLAQKFENVVLESTTVK